MDERLKTDVMDGKVVKCRFEESDHYGVLMKMKLNDRWKFKERLEGENISKE